MGGKLKLLIVDDEPLSRERICSFRLEGCCFEIAGEAEDGREALEKIDRIHPDIVVTDIVMPVMGGLDLLKEIRKRPNPPKVVILTCHEDFEKAQTALRLGAQDYIVKLMLRENDFKESIQKIADIIFRERRERKQSIIGSIRGLMHAGSGDEARRYLERLSDRNFGIACYRLVRLYSPAGLLKGAEPVGGGFRFAQVEDGRSPTCLLWSDGPASPVSFNGETKAFLERLAGRGETPREFRALAGAVYRGAGTLPAAYRSLEDYERHMFYLEGKKGLCFQTLPVPPFGAYPQDAFLEGMETCRKYCGSGDYDRLGAHWMEWIGKLRQCRPQPESALSMMRMAVSCVAEPLSRLRMEDRPLDAWMEEKLAGAKTMDEASDCFSAAARLLSSRQGQTAKAMRSEIQDALSYIAENYSRGISLQSAARHVQLSESWFGALFRSEVRKSFSEYLICYRISKAKKLLRSSSLTVSQVSESVGISDPHYFTRIFTERTGVNPKKYRAGEQNESAWPAEGEGSRAG